MDSNFDENYDVGKRRRSSILKPTRQDVQQDIDSTQFHLNKENVTGGFTKSYRRVSFAEDVRARVYTPCSEGKLKSSRKNKAVSVEDATELNVSKDLIETEQSDNSRLRMDIQKHLFEKHHILSSPSKRPLQELNKESIIDTGIENPNVGNDANASVDRSIYNEESMELSAESPNLDKSVYFHTGSNDMSICCTVYETPNTSLNDSVFSNNPDICINNRLSSIQVSQRICELSCESMELTQDISGKIIEVFSPKITTSNENLINFDQKVPWNYANLVNDTESSENVEHQELDNTADSFHIPVSGPKPSFFTTSTNEKNVGFSEENCIVKLTKCRESIVDCDASGVYTRTVNASKINDEMEVVTSQAALPVIQNNEVMQDLLIQFDGFVAPKLAFIKGRIENTVNVSKINDELEGATCQAEVPVIQNNEEMQDSHLEFDELVASKPAFIKGRIENAVNVSKTNDELEGVTCQAVVPVIQNNEEMQDSHLEFDELVASKPAFIKDRIENAVNVFKINDELESVTCQAVFPAIQKNEAILCSHKEFDALVAPKSEFIKEEEKVSNKSKTLINEVVSFEEGMELAKDAPIAINETINSFVLDKIKPESSSIKSSCAAQKSFFGTMGQQPNCSPAGAENPVITKTLLPEPSITGDIDISLFSASRNMFFQAPVNEDLMNVTSVLSEANNMVQTMQVTHYCEKSPLHLAELPLNCTETSFTIFSQMEESDKSVLNICEISSGIGDLELPRLSPEKTQIIVETQSEKDKTAQQIFAASPSEKTLTAEDEICLKSFTITENPNRITNNDRRLTYVLEELRKDRTFTNSREGEKDDDGENNIEFPLQNIDFTKSQHLKATPKEAMPNRITKNDRRLTYVLEELRSDRTFINSREEKNNDVGENIEFPLQDIHSSQSLNLKATLEEAMNEKPAPKNISDPQSCRKKVTSTISKVKRVPNPDSNVEKKNARSKSKEKKREISATEMSPVPKKRSRVKKTVEALKSTKVVNPTKISLPKVVRSLEQRCSRLLSDNLAESIHSLSHTPNIENSNREVSLSSCSEPKKRKLCDSSSIETSISDSLSVDQYKEKPFERSHNTFDVSNIETTDVARSQIDTTQEVERDEQTLVAKPDEPKTALTAVLSPKHARECSGDNNEQLLSTLVPSLRLSRKEAENILAKTSERAKPTSKLGLTQEENTKSKFMKLKELRLQIFGLQEEKKKLSFLTTDDEKDKILKKLDCAIENKRIEIVRSRREVAEVLQKADELERNLPKLREETKRDLDKLQFSLARLIFGSPKHERGFFEIVVKSWSTSKIHVQIWTSAIEIQAVLGKEVEKPESGPWNKLDNRTIASVDRSFDKDELKTNYLLEFAHQLLWNYQNSMGHLLNACKTSYDFIEILKMIGEATCRSKMVLEDLEWIRDSDKHKFQLNGNQLSIWFMMPLREAEFLIIFNLGIEMYSKDGLGVINDDCTKPVTYKHVRGVTGEDRILSAVDSVTWGDYYVKNVIRAVDRWVYISKWYT